jgi:hemerythrin-like domain-containing protein
VTPRSEGPHLKPIEQLKEEHDAIKLMLRILERVCEKLESGQQVDQAHLKQMVEFISVFADRCHHGKEEDLLFPEMEKAGIPKEAGPVAVMLKEHAMGREYVSAMSNAIAQYEPGNQQASSKFAQNARRYISLLTQHIEKEDNILYPIADTRIPKVKQDELLKEFEKIEQEKIGVGKHEELHNLLKRLEETYLQKTR